MTEINVIGMLDIMKNFKMKPNFSELARLYGLDRHSIKKYYDNGGKKVITKARRSRFDQYKDKIIS